MASIKNLLSDIAYLEKKIEERQEAVIGTYLDVLTTDDIRRLADGDQELSDTIQKFVDAGESPHALRIALYPPPPEPVKVEPPEPPPSVEVEPVKAQTNEFWGQYQDTPEAQPSPAPEPPPQNGVIRVKFNGETAPASFSIKCADGETRPVKQNEVYVITEETLKNLSVYPATWWQRV